MITTLIASTIFAGTGCHVPVQRVVAHQATYGYQAAAVVNYGYAQNYTPYYTASALAYKVEDPERAALVRQNEKLTDAVIGELKAKSEKIDRLESAKPAGGELPHEALAEKAASVAPAILKAACAKCHSGDKYSGGFALALAPDGKASLEMRSLIYDVVSQGEMPPKSAKQLSEDEKKAIAEWAAASREELKAAVKSAKK